MSQRLVGYPGVMTYSSVDMELYADHPHILTGDPGCDTSRLLIKEEVAHEGSPEDARKFLQALRVQ